MQPCMRTLLKFCFEVMIIASIFPP
uniref:Uncharacterized protein n=1 Tax=Rhizophora mucronata TaxID=61149 RepID=A0A2P2NGR4_RHIMU